MLTSKEIIERTGISRATLNNYISCGLVSRPQVLPPGPADGAAPRIGYFPDDTVTRVETIQRLKKEGWSISRISEFFAAHPLEEAAALALTTATAPRAGAAVEAPAPLPTAGFASDAALRLSLQDAGHAAYFVNDRFRVTWLNEQARSGSLSPLARDPASGSGENVFGHLLALEESPGRDAILRLHLDAARSRSATPADLFADLVQEQVSRLERLYREAKSAVAGIVTHTRVPSTGSVPARLAYAVQFREGVLFAYAPAGAEEALPASSHPARTAFPPAAPAIRSVAVLFATLQDAAGLWVKLTAQEYFELVNEVSAELDRIFRRHQGRAGRHPDEGLVCYFLPQRDGNYLWNALAAANQAQEAMRQVSLRWQARKGWDVEVCMNAGIDEGQDWMGAMGAADQSGLRVLGDAADRAEQLSRCSRMGAVLVTRTLFGKLSADERQRVTYGVPRPAIADADGQLLFSFARLEDLAAPAPVPERVADLAVAELLALHSPNANPGPSGAG